MSLNKFLCIVILVFTATISFAQLQVLSPPIYSLTRVYLSDNYTFEELANLGLDLESIMTKTNKYIELPVDNSDIPSLNKKGYKTEIIIDNLSDFYSARLSQKSSPSIQSEKYFKYGSMGGYYTYDEANETFAEMQSTFPEFSKPEMIIGYTLENRPIFAFNFGNASASTPQVLITALHHAREGEGLSALVYFMWDLLDKAQSGDPEAKYLLEHRNIWVIPVLNPDGYEYNYQTYPAGGGMWRKNRRPNSNGTFGVDLNRNYGPYNNWNDNVNGEPKSETYKGTEPFSELETQAIRDFCYQKNFSVALNYHTHGNLLIHPYSAKNNPCEDSVEFRAMAIDYTKYSNLAFGLPKQTVGYIVFGGSDDWMYMPDDYHSKIYAMTPELGTRVDGFWPAKDRIIPIAQENLYMNYQNIWSAGTNLRIKSLEFEYDSTSGKSQLILQTHNIGTQKPSNISPLSINSLDDKVKILNSDRNILSLNMAAVQIDTFQVIIKNGFRNGASYPFEITINQDGILRKDTLPINIYKSQDHILFSNNSDTNSIKNDWNLGGWGFQVDSSNNEIFLADSPYSDYKDSITNYMIYKTPISVFGRASYLEFQTKWAIEANSDFAVIEASSDNGFTWKPLYSDRMILGAGAAYSKQLLGVPGFNGQFPYWYKQSCSLNDYLGQSIILRFGVLSDMYLHFDGFNLKDIKVVRFPDITDTPDIHNQSYSLNCYPNPVGKGNNLYLELSLPQTEIVETYDVKIADILGKILYKKTVPFSSSGSQFLTVPTNELSSGVYFVHVEIGSQMIKQKFLVTD